MLENIFKCDFSERKKEIDDILMSEITTRDTNETNNDDLIQTSDDEKPKESFIKKNKKQSKKINNYQNEQIKSIHKSDEELAMEIHQQENRPSLRHSRPIVFSFFIFLFKLFILFRK